MLRQRWVLAIALTLLACGKVIGGEYGNSDPWHNVWTDWHRNNCWMEPFNIPDRASVGNFMDAQIAKGWQMQCLLGDPHFEPDNNKLSPAGVSKLRELLRNPALAHPVFVERAWTDETTAKRLAAVQRAVAEMSRGTAPDVLVSNLPLSTAPADSVNGVNTWLSAYMQGIPKPTPKAFQNNDSSGSGSSGSP